MYKAVLIFGFAVYVLIKILLSGAKLILLVVFYTLFLQGGEYALTGDGVINS